MSQSRPPHISILALGNLMRTDDAVGMLTARTLQESGRLPSTVEVIEGGTLGLDLLGMLDETTHLLVLDAVDFGAAPGTLKSFQGEAIARLPTSKSVHLLGLSDLINAMVLMDAPSMEMVLLGIQPESTDWGTVLTAKIEAAQSSLLEAALEQIARWEAQFSSVALDPIRV